MVGNSAVVIVHIHKFANAKILVLLVQDTLHVE